MQSLHNNLSSWKHKLHSCKHKSAVVIPSTTKIRDYTGSSGKYWLKLAALGVTVGNK